MKVVGIIAEYNPFHKGHEYHIQMAKKITKSDYCVVIMSPNFVQRGTPAIIDKYVRTKMALSGGADLVLELPTPYACGSAEIFAKGSLRILNGLNIVDYLCFGSENAENQFLDETSPYFQIAHALLNETQEYSFELKKSLKSGLSFPKARAYALQLSFPDFTDPKTLETLLNSPNAILGIEYCKALLQLNSKIQPVTINRIGNNYHDSALSDQFSSATSIRTSMEQNELSYIHNEVPESTYSLLESLWEKTGPVFVDDFSLLLHFSLLQQVSITNDFTCFYDVNKEISDKINKNLYSYHSFSNFCETLKSKEITSTRISRSLLHILLGLKKSDMEEFLMPSFNGYARILGFRQDACELLSTLKRQTQIPIITKPADAKKILSDSTAFRLFDAETKASHIYNSVVTNKYGVSTKHEYTNQIIIF